MGTTFALRQSEGTSPVSSEALKIKVRIGATSIASCFRIIGLISGRKEGNVYTGMDKTSLGHQLWEFICEGLCPGVHVTSDRQAC